MLPPLLAPLLLCPERHRGVGLADRPTSNADAGVDEREGLPCLRPSPPTPRYPDTHSLLVQFPRAANKSASGEEAPPRFVLWPRVPRAPPPPLRLSRQKATVLGLLAHGFQHTDHPALRRLSTPLILNLPARPRQLAVLSASDLKQVPCKREHTTAPPSLNPDSPPLPHLKWILRPSGRWREEATGKETCRGA